LQTGKDHWEVLCRARAIEFQSYVLACGQWGPYQDGQGETHYNYGNSLVCNPWGLVVARATEGIGWVTTTLQQEAIAAARNSIPMSAHRRAVGDEHHLPD
jgi:nitrilase